MNLNLTPRITAVGLAFAAYTCWVLSDTCLKIAGSSALPVYEVVALVGLASMVLLLAYALWHKDLGVLWPRNPRRQLLRSCLDLANNAGVFVALRHLPLALFYILIFSSPMVTTLLAAVLLGERLEWRKTIAILMGFLGVVVAVNPHGLVRQDDWIGYLACAGCVCVFSLNVVLSRVLTRTESPESLTFFSSAMRLVIGGAAMMHYATPVTARFATVLSASGLFFVMGSLCFFVAIKFAPAATVSQYQYSQLVTGGLIAYLIWDERLTHMMIVGATLIIGSGWYTAALSYKDRDKTQPAIRVAS